MTSKSTPTQAAVRERLQQLKAGTLDAEIGLVGLAGNQDERVTKERLVRFCLVAANAALPVLSDWSEGVSLAATLMAVKENWVKQKAMSQRGLIAAQECLWGLHLHREHLAESALHKLTAKELEQVALSLGVLMADFTMALEEQAKISQSHATPTLL